MTSKKKPTRTKAKAKTTVSRGAAKPGTKKKATKKAAKAGKKAAGKKTGTKKAAAKKSTAKAPARKATTKKTATKKAPVKKTAAKATSTKAPMTKAGATKAGATKKAATRKAAVGKTVAEDRPPTSAEVRATAARLAQQEIEPKAPRTELEETSTEDLWIIYRDQVGKPGPQAKLRLDELRNTLIERHYTLVKYIAERLLQTLPKSIELDDLISAGLFGLMDAIRGFDADRGIKFKTYCSTRVRGAILDQLRSQDWVPRLVRLKASRIERCLQKLTAEYGREPTHTELAQSLKMEHGELVKEIEESRAKTMFSLSEKWEDDDGSVEKVEVLEDKAAIDPVRELNRRDLMTFITRSLTHKERFIIEQYYQYGHTMREIGEMLALTESRVCQIHSNVMGRLKGLLGQKSGTLTGS